MKSMYPLLSEYIGFLCKLPTNEMILESQAQMCMKNITQLSAAIFSLDPEWYKVILWVWYFGLVDIKYCLYSKYLDRNDWAKSVDDIGLHW